MMKTRKRLRFVVFFEKKIAQFKKSRPPKKHRLRIAVFLEKRKSDIFEYVRVIVVTLAITYGILFFVQISRVYGTSMVPTYQDGNIVLVNKFFYKQGEVNRNDIVVVDVKEPNQEQKYIIKRVVGIGGDHLEIINNELYVNGALMDEDYINEAMYTSSDMSVDVPKGKIFVMGDNRNNSKDSRAWGCFDFDEDVVGEVFFTVPLT